jgi:hypothetical protein
MSYKNYWRDIVAKYRVYIEGWPDEILFGNLSDVATSLPALEKLRSSWKSGRTFFRVLSDAEFEKLDDERSQRIEDGEEEVHVRKTRCDKGTQRKASNGNLRKRQRTSHRSRELISDSDEENQPIASSSTS